MNVYDTLSAFTTSWYAVKVNSTTSFFSLSYISNFLNSSLSSSGGSNDEIKQIVSLSNDLLNSNTNCSYAPNCSALHRNQCSVTANTCGSCVSSDAYIGEMGDSNHPCYLLSDLNVRRNRLLLSNSSYCSSSNDCNVFEECNYITKTCYLPLKSCANQCSGHGYCTFVNIDSGVIAVNECYVGTSSCIAQCQCEPEYNLSSTCSNNNTEMSTKQSLRYKVILSLKQLLIQEDADKNNIISWSDLLAGIATQVDEISQEASYQQVHNLVQLILSSALVATDTISYSDVMNVMMALDAASEANLKLQEQQQQQQENNTRRYLIEKDDSSDYIHRLLFEKGPEVKGNYGIGTNYSDYVANTLSSCHKYNQLIKRQLQPGQAHVDTINGNFRFRTVSVDPNMFLQQSNLQSTSLRSLVESTTANNATSFVNISVEVPATDLELYNNKLFNSILLPLQFNQESVNILQVTALQIKSHMYMATKNSFLSNSLEMSLDGLICILPPCSINIILQFTDVLDSFTTTTTRYLSSNNTTTTASSSIEVVNVTCKHNEITSQIYTCNDGYQLITYCNGTAGYVQNRCPLSKIGTICNALSNSSVVDSSCRVLRYTNTNVTCQCSVLSDKELKSNVNYIAMLEFIFTTFESTYSSLTSIDTSTLIHNRKVLYVFGVFLIASLSLLMYAQYLDNRDFKKEKEKQSLNSIKQYDDLNKIDFNHNSNNNILHIISNAMIYIINNVFCLCFCCYHWAIQRKNHKKSHNIGIYIYIYVYK